MFPLKEGQGSTGRFRSSSIVVLIHAAVLLLLTRCCEGQSQVIGPPQPIITIIGEDVILPCRLEPLVDAVSMDVEWSRRDLIPRFVHVRRGGQDLLIDQNLAFEGRTSVFMDRLRVGDVSLKLSRVKLSDAGTYRCFIPGLNKDAAVQLVVGSISSPAITDINRNTDGVVLQCQSEGWYPEPEVSWLDGEGKHLSAVKTETVRGPDGLYTVSSRLTVKEKHSNSFTCRVQQKNINQIRETTVQITEDGSSDKTLLAVLISLVVFAVVLLLTGLLLWKLRQNKRQNNKNRGSNSEAGTPEEKRLLKKRQKKNLQDKEKEKKVLERKISALENQKRQLETLRDRDNTKLDEVEKKLRENDKNNKLSSVYSDSDEGESKKSFLETRQTLQKEKTEYQNSLQSTEEKLQETNETLKERTEMKQNVENQINEIKKQLEKTKRKTEETQREDQPQI